MNETGREIIGCERHVEQRISVVVPVYNRSDQLRQLLVALADQDYPLANFEVLVCDDGSTENLASIIQESCQRSGLSVLHLRQANHGAGAARNLGLAHADGEIIAFTDSDCVPAREWLSQISRTFEDPTVGIAGGKVDSRLAEHVSGRCVNFVMSSMLGSGGARNPQTGLHMKYYPRTCNLAVRRELAREAGGFSTYSHGEDLEFSHKVLKLGVRVAFVESAVILHNEMRSLAQVAREAAYKGMARVRLARQHGMHEWIHTLPALFCLYLVVFLAMGAMGHAILSWPVVPLALYALAMGMLAVQGGHATKDWRVGLLAPCYALIMHLGYGLGYWCGWFEAFVLRPLRGVAHRLPSAPPLPPRSDADAFSHCPALVAGDPGKPPPQ